MPYLSASAVVIHYEEALYQVYGPFIYPEYFKEDSKCTKQTDKDEKNW